MQPESSDGFASVGTILPEEGAALLPGGSFRFFGADRKALLACNFDIGRAGEAEKGRCADGRLSLSVSYPAP
jgi:hypothetical protein